MVQGPGQRLACRGLLGIQPPRRGQLAGTGLQRRGGLLRHLERVPGRSGCGIGVFARLGQEPVPIGSQRLQHHVPEPAIRIRPRRYQQRAIHQAQHRRPGARPPHRLGGLQSERPREHRHRPEHPPLGLIEQLVAPLNGGGQRSLPIGREPMPRSQQVEPVIEAVQQLGEPQCLHPGRGQLDRQRHSVQPGHHPRYGRPGRPVQRESWIDQAGPVREQRHRLGSGHVGQVIGIGQGQRRQPVPALPGHVQRLPAGGQHPHVSTGGQQPGAQLRRRGDHMLTVVQYQQQPMLVLRQRRRQRFFDGRPRQVTHPQRCRHRCRDLRRVPHRGQLGQPYSVREPARHPPGYLADQSGFARTARPDHGHHPVLLQQAFDLGHWPGATHETGHGFSEPVYAAPHGASRRLTHSDNRVRARAVGVQVRGWLAIMDDHLGGSRRSVPAVSGGRSTSEHLVRVVNIGQVTSPARRRGGAPGQTAAAITGMTGACPRQDPPAPCRSGC